jgi:outer membrane protein assembly factor BamA
MSLLMLTLFFSSCNPTKRLQDGDVFLKKQSISIENAPPEYKVDKEDLEFLLRQKANRKIFLFFRFNLWVYNMVPPGKIEKAEAKKVERRIKRSNKKIAKGKKPLKDKKETLWHWMAYTVGEPPAVLDSALTVKSKDQLEIFLKKKGFFDVTVDVKTDTVSSGRKAKIVYKINPGKPFLMREINYRSNDPVLSQSANYFKNTGLLKPGDLFDVEKLDEERERITRYLNNNGYFTFTKNYIQFEADSTAGDHLVDVGLFIKNPMKESILDPDSLELVPYEKYSLANIYIHTEYDPTRQNEVERDTLDFESIKILSNGPLDFKPELLNYTLYLKLGELYSKDNVDLTYRRFNSLGVFRSVSITFTENRKDGKPLLDCHIYLNPAKRQGMSLETTGTHRSGILGISANLVYNHKNVFRGAEAFEARIRTGFEAQPPLTLISEDEQQAGADLSRSLVLNTFEIGPELRLYFPRLYPFKFSSVGRNSDPSTIVNLSYNYQKRPDYQRTVSSLGISYRFKESKRKTHLLNLAELSVIKIDKSAAFEQRLSTLNDLFLQNSYRDHLVISSGYTFQYNNQENAKQPRYVFNSANIELAGNFMRLLGNTLGAEPDEFGSYRILDIRYAQFILVENDFRLYRNIGDRNDVVLRFNAGVGLPLDNLEVLPFEKSFFSGGSNGLRAWQARTLGPGSYRDSTAAVTYNNIGELKFEANFEYRFDLAGSLKGAFFVDAGNIWLLKEDDLRPGSGFSLKKFPGEIAVGAGLGLRFDFDYFLIRLDTGFQLKDPAKIEGERWFFQPKTEYNTYLQKINPLDPAVYRMKTTFNLGIGYPF